MIADSIERSIQARINAKLRDPAQRNLVKSTIMHAFAGVRKRNVPDLAKRIADFESRVERMVPSLVVEFQRQTLVVRSRGADDGLLNQLRRGSDWFDPEPEIDNIIVASLLLRPQRT